MKNKKHFPAETLMLVLGMSISLMFIFYRLDLIALQNIEPYTQTRKIVYTTYDQYKFAFFNDEYTYYNYGEKSLESVRNALNNFFESGRITYINLYPIYFELIKSISKNWRYLFFVTGFLFYVLFGISLIKSLNQFYTPTKQRMLAFAFVFLSPILIFLSITWLRDLLIAFLLIESIYYIKKDRLITFFVLSILLFLLRNYMIFIQFVIFLFLRNQNNRTNITKNFKVKIFLVILSVSILGIYLSSNYLFFSQNIAREFFPRLVEALSGITLGLLVSSRNVYKFRGDLFDFEVLSYYYFIIYYFVFYFLLLKRKRNITNNFKIKENLTVFFISAFFYAFLHGGIFGGFNNRIKMIPWAISIFLLLELLEDKVSERKTNDRKIL